jgi:hypothetical protein
MDRILVRVMTLFRDLGWNVVDRDDAVEQRYYDEDQQAEREIVQERIFHCGVLRKTKRAEATSSAAPTKGKNGGGLIGVWLLPVHDVCGPTTIQKQYRRRHIEKLDLHQDAEAWAAGAPQCMSESALRIPFNCQG